SSPSFRSSLDEATMRILRVLMFTILALAAALAMGQSVATSGDSSSTKPSQGFSVDNIDKSVDPCVDFYQYACGNWLKNTEIPADQTEWVSFTELYERNLVTLREILEKTSQQNASRNAIEQKIGDYYGACMDEKAADAKGLD